METLDEIGIRYDITEKLGSGDKTSRVHNYLYAYDEIFAPRRHKPVQLLEIGVFKGESLATWADYFRNGTIHGIDIDPERFREGWPKLVAIGARQDVLFTAGDATKPGMLNDKTFDIIIDDGSHQPQDIIDAFRVWFPRLKKRGTYVIEDVLMNHPTHDNYAKVKAHFDSIMPHVFLHYDDGRLVLGEFEQSIVRDARATEDWEATIRSVTYMRQMIVVEKH